MDCQFLFCVETDKRARTDEIYIKETLNRFFEAIPNTVRIGFIFMHGKSNYNSDATKGEIRKLTQMFRKNGKTVVMYCIDTDKYESNQNHKRELEEIQRFCTERDYELIWFCHDVEEVYIGHSVADAEKKDIAETFKRREMIKDADIANFSSETMAKNKSNIICVLKKYFILRDENKKRRGQTR